MMILAQIVGILAVILFLLCFQFKKRNTIILVNIISRLLYVLQYILLGALEGAVLDISGTVSSFVAKHKDRPFLSRMGRALPILFAFILTGVGLLTYKNLFSIFAICGLLLETTALWITKESKIRLLSLASAPFWMTYNISCQAYGSALGNALMIISVVLAIYRYDIKGEKNG